MAYCSNVGTDHQSSTSYQTKPTHYLYGDHTMKRISRTIAAALVVGLFLPVNAAQADPSTTFATTGEAPRMMVIDQSGNIYTANFGSNNVSKITQAGVSTIFATTSTQPAALVFDQDGNLYTANYGADNVSKITQAGVSTIFGTTGSGPIGIAIDIDGNIYTSNSGSNNVSRITYSPDGNVSSLVGVTGDSPNGIVIDSAGNIYTANGGAGSYNVSKISGGSSRILGTTGDGPWGIAIDSSGNIYTSNFLSNSVSKISPYGVSRILGTTGSHPTGIAIDASGNVYAANRDSNSITKITPASSSDGNYSCSTGLKSAVAPTYTITSGVVSAGYSCSGAVIISSQATAIGDYAFGSDGEQHSNLTSITIPNSVTSIGDFSFAGSPLASITIPDKVTYIGIRAFSDTRLTSITIPSSVTSMGQRTFVNVHTLTSVTIQNGITELPLYLFAGCDHLLSFVIPNTVTELEESMFENSGITSITIPSSVTTIGQTFRDSSITSVNIGSGVSFIHQNAFYNMPNLRSINVDAGNQNFSSIDGVLLNKAGTAFIQYPAGKVGTSYVIPNGVTTINKEYTFNSSRLTSITIPNSVRELRNGVFNPLRDTLDSYEYCEISLTSDNFSSAGLGGKTKTCPKTSPRISAGTEPNSKVATIPLGATSALISATDALPGTQLSFGGTVPTAVTVVPVAENPGAPSTTPFKILGSTKIVDIKITGSFNGSATVCLDGSEDDHIFHYAGDPAAWVELPSRTYSKGQVCGVTTSFSPFAAAPVKTISGAPTSVTAISTSPTSADVSFEAPESDGGSNITSYTATSSPGGITGTISQSGSGTITVTGLTPGIGYTFTVKATNYIGTSVASSVSNSSTGILVRAMMPSDKPVVTLTTSSIMCTMGTHSATPTSSAFSLFVDGKHISTNFSAVGDYLPDWIIAWATPGTITRTASLTSATWAMSDAYKGKSVTCSTLAYSNHATGTTTSRAVTAP